MNACCESPHLVLSWSGDSSMVGVLREQRVQSSQFITGREIINVKISTDYVKLHSLILSYFSCSRKLYEHTTPLVCLLNE